jgi:hypothetical protein
MTRDASLAPEGRRDSQYRSTLSQAGAESADEIIGDVSRVRRLNRGGNLECPGLGQNAGLHEVNHQTETPAEANGQTRF